MKNVLGQSVIENSICEKGMESEREKSKKIFRDNLGAFYCWESNQLYWHTLQWKLEIHLYMEIGIDFFNYDMSGYSNIPITLKKCGLMKIGWIP